MNPAPIAPVLIFAWGNPSRGDDALGPMFVEQLAEPPGALLSSMPFDTFECLSDYQLQIEHALDLAGRQRVLFVDASLDCKPPFEVTSLKAARDASFTTHSMSPESVMQVYRDLYGVEPAPCTLLAIRGERFELGEAPTRTALSNLQNALNWCRQWLRLTPPLGTSGTHEAEHA